MSPLLTLGVKGSKGDPAQSKAFALRKLLLDSHGALDNRLQSNLDYANLVGPLKTV